MAQEINVRFELTGGEHDRVIADRWIRREFDLTHEQYLTIGTSKTQLLHALSDIKLVYVVVRTEGFTGTLSLFKNLSPESIQLANMYLAYELDGVTTSA